MRKGFNQSKNDYSLFIKKLDGKITIATVYVDDIILTGNDAQGIADLKAHLDSTLSIKVLGKLIFFLGIEVGYIPSGITHTEEVYT